MPDRGILDQVMHSGITRKEWARIVILEELRSIVANTISQTTREYGPTPRPHDDATRDEFHKWAEDRMQFKHYPLAMELLKEVINEQVP